MHLPSTIQIRCCTHWRTPQLGKQQCLIFLKSGNRMIFDKPSGSAFFFKKILCYVKKKKDLHFGKHSLTKCRKKIHLCRHLLAAPWSASSPSTYPQWPAAVLDKRPQPPFPMIPVIPLGATCSVAVAWLGGGIPPVELQHRKIHGAEHDALRV